MSEADILKHALSVLKHQRQWIQQRQQMRALPGSVGESDDGLSFGKSNRRNGSESADVLAKTNLASDLAVLGEQIERPLSSSSPLKQNLPDLTSIRPPRPRNAWGGVDVDAKKEGLAAPVLGDSERSTAPGRRDESAGEIFPAGKAKAAASAVVGQNTSTSAPTLRPSVVRAWGDLDNLVRGQVETGRKEMITVDVEPAKDNSDSPLSSPDTHKGDLDGGTENLVEKSTATDLAGTNRGASLGQTQRKLQTEANDSESEHYSKGREVICEDINTHTVSAKTADDITCSVSATKSAGNGSTCSASPNLRVSRRKRQFAKKKSMNSQQNTQTDKKDEDGFSDVKMDEHDITTENEQGKTTESRVSPTTSSGKMSSMVFAKPSSSAGVAAIVNQLPPLRLNRFLSSEAVRPVVPPPYFLPAHQEKRPDSLPELPCPLYGEVDENEVTDKGFSEPTSSVQLNSQEQKTLASRMEFGQEPIPPLHHAAWVGNARRLESLLCNGRTVNEEDRYGRTALIYSVHGAHILCADVLIKHGANLDHQAKDGSTALHEAAYVGALSLIELLLYNGASPLNRDQEGRLPIHYATYNKSEKCLAALAKAPGVNINAVDKAGMTPLMWAAYHDRPEVVRWLSAQGADREEKDIDGRTAMHWAVHKTSVKCLKLLLEHDMTYFKDHRGLTVLHIAADRGSMPATKMILKMRPDSIHDLDKQGRSPLHWAAVCSRVDVCLLLLEYGTSPTLKDSQGKTPLDYARIKDLKYVVALLMCYDWDSRPGLQPSTSSLSLLSRFSNRVASEVSGRATSPTPTPDHNHHGEDPSPGHSVLAQTKLSDEHSQIITDGCYLKYFTGSGRGPLQDRFFWFSLNNTHVCWSKLQADRILGDYNSARLLSVEAGVNQIVKGRSDFAPKGRHRYNFTLLTSSVAMQVVAYTSSHYQAWVEGLGGFLQSKLHEQVASSQSIQPLKSGDDANTAWTGKAPCRLPRQQLFQVAGYTSTQPGTLSQPAQN